MHAERVAFRGRKQIDHEQMDPFAYERDALFEKFLKGVFARFVARRDDLNDCDCSPDFVLDNDTIRFVRVAFLRGFADDMRLGRFEQQRPAQQDGRHFGFFFGGATLDQCTQALWQLIRVQSVFDADRPTLMKIVE